MTSIGLTVIPGDEIGPEVVAEGLKILDVTCETLGGPEIVTHAYDLDARRYLVTGETFTDTDLENIKGHDAILLGVTGDPRVPSGVLEHGLFLKLRFALDHYVSLRPNRCYPGVPTSLADPGGIDSLMVRGGTEGLYYGDGGVVRQGTPHEMATEVSIGTAYGVERAVRYAFAKA